LISGKEPKRPITRRKLNLILEAIRIWLDPI